MTPRRLVVPAAARQARRARIGPRLDPGAGACGGPAPDLIGGAGAAVGDGDRGSDPTGVAAAWEDLGVRRHPTPWAEGVGRS